MKSRSLKFRTLAGAVLFALVGLPAAQSVQNTTTTFEYDANGNLKKVIDPLNRINLYQYDALDRPVQVTDPANGITQYGYNALDKLTRVVDPRNLITQYTVDGLGNLTQQQSPDTGITTNTYDAAGNLLTRTDAKGQTTTYQYDVLNRVTLITNADSTTVGYVYDQGTNGIGRLTQITDASGSTQFSYDPHGREVAEVKTIGGQTYTTSYRYDSVGHLIGMTYPSGRSLDYTLDSSGRINQITATLNGLTQLLVAQVSYQPFGPAIAVVFGNSQTYQAYNRSYDLDGRIGSYTLNNQLQTLNYDAASHIVGRTDAGNAANTTSYGYDALDRLTSAQTSNSSLGFGYDAAGNRISKINGSATSTYSYGTTSNQLTQISGSQSAVINTDANGSIVNNGNSQFSFDARGRMLSANTAVGTVQYKINGLGQRVQKISPNETTVFHYDNSGKLIAESNGYSNVEYIYLNDMPIAVLK